MNINELTDRALLQVSQKAATGNIDLRTIIYMAIQAGMADAYERGIKVGEDRAKQQEALVEG